MFLFFESNISPVNIFAFFLFSRLFVCNMDHKKLKPTPITMLEETILYIFVGRICMNDAFEGPISQVKILIILWINLIRYYDKFQKFDSSGVLVEGRVADLLATPLVARRYFLDMSGILRNKYCIKHNCQLV